MALTDDMMEKLSTEIPKENIDSLSFKLGILPQDVGQAFIRNCSDTLTIRKAVYDVLHDWFRGQSNPKEAYSALHEAMTHPDVKLKMIAAETLDS